MMSYLYNKNSHTCKDCPYIEMGPSISFQNINLVWCHCNKNHPDSKVHGANMGPTWVLLAPDGPHVGPMNLAIGEFSPKYYW